MYQMARPAGLEPATIRLEGGCSIQLSYGRLFICIHCGAQINSSAYADQLHYRLTQLEAVLDKRGACYRQSPTPSTENLKKVQ